MASHSRHPGPLCTEMASHTHLVVIPSFNSGARLRPTVQAAQAAWPHVWVVVDGSTDGSADHLPNGARRLVLPHNGGKGAAVRHAVRQAADEGFTHALVMDGDGQHPADRIQAFMAASIAQPDAMVLGCPVFGADAPQVRVLGRRLSNWCAALATGGAPTRDSLFGFRVYPIAPLLRAMDESPGMRGFDFDPEAMVRLCWAGVPSVVLPAPVRYWRAGQGGVSHFRYVRDNILLIAMHLRLGVHSLVRQRLP